MWVTRPRRGEGVYPTLKGEYSLQEGKGGLPYTRGGVFLTGLGLREYPRGSVFRTEIGLREYPRGGTFPYRNEGRRMPH